MQFIFVQFDDALPSHV